MKKLLNDTKKVSPLLVLLITLSTVSMLVSNIIAGKNIPLGVSVFGNDLTLTAGVLVFPITYILSDLFSEVYGYTWTRRSAWIAFAMNLFMVIVFEIAIALPYPVWWGNQEAFQAVLGNTFGMLAASLLAYMVGDFVNDVVFEKMKANHSGTDGFCARAIASSFCGEISDSCIFLPLMYLLTGQMGTTITAWYQLVAMIMIQALLKTAYEIIIVPITLRLVKKAKAYEEGLE